MPSSATITAFYTFAANSKARATQVNNNFDMFRGHIVPIEPLTTTSSDMTYDLGSSEHRWRSAYVREVDIRSNTSTGNTLKLGGDTSGASPGFVFKVNDVEVGRVATRGETTTAAKGGFAISPRILLSTSSTITATDIAGSTITVVSTGKPIIIGICGGDQTTTSSQIRLINTSNSPSPLADVRIHASGSLLSFYRAQTSFTVTLTSVDIAFPPAFTTIYTPAAGTYNFNLAYVTGANSATAASLILQNVRLYAYEV